MDDLKIEEVHVLELFIPVGYPPAGSGTNHVYGPVCTTMEMAETTAVAGDKRIFKIAVPMRYNNGT